MTAEEKEKQRIYMKKLGHQMQLHQFNLLIKIQNTMHTKGLAEQSKMNTGFIIPMSFRTTLLRTT